MHIRKIVRIPTGGAGLSEPFGVSGYRLASIAVPGNWTTANITFRGSALPPPNVMQVRPTGTTAGLAVDANAYDIEMANAVTLERHGDLYTPAKVDPIDISALLSAAATVGTSKFGILWVFQKLTGSDETGVVAVEVDKTAADYTSLIQALAQFSVATRTLPSRELYVPIGAVAVQEGGSGAFTWGTDSITAETETYYSFAGLPEMTVRAASLALDTGAATYTYGAAKARLGTGTLVSLSGKANATIAGSNVADGAFGAWLLYALADDVEHPLQLGAAYPTLADAQAAVAAHRANPLLPIFGVLYITNASGAPFVPGTTKLDASGITATFVTTGPRLPNVYADGGTELSVTAAADRVITLGAYGWVGGGSGAAGDTKENLSGLGCLQLRSGTVGTAVDQVNSPDLVVTLERY